MSSVVVDLTGSDDEAAPDRVDPIEREVARRKAMQAVLATAELVLPPGCKKPMLIILTPYCSIGSMTEVKNTHTRNVP